MISSYSSLYFFEIFEEGVRVSSNSSVYLVAGTDVFHAEGNLTVSLSSRCRNFFSISSEALTVNRIVN